MAMPPSKPARKIRFIKHSCVVNCDAPSWRDVQPQKWNNTGKNGAKSSMCDGLLTTLRKHYNLHHGVSGRCGCDGKIIKVGAGKGSKGARSRCVLIHSSGQNGFETL